MRMNLTSCLNSCNRVLFKFYPAQFQLKISLAPSINNAAPHGVLAPATAPPRHAPLRLGWVQLAYVAHIHNILHGMYSMCLARLELWRRLFSPFAVETKGRQGFWFIKMRWGGAVVLVFAEQSQAVVALLHLLHTLRRPLKLINFI